MVLDSNNVELGVLVMKSLKQAAGGTHMIYPAFQRALVDEYQKRKIPIMLDEVFTRLWILGELSSAHFLGVEPDVAVYSKSLTAGTVPLSVTVPTKDVFRTFDAPSNREALFQATRTLPGRLDVLQLLNRSGYMIKS